MKVRHNLAEQRHKLTKVKEIGTKKILEISYDMLSYASSKVIKSHLEMRHLFFINTILRE